MKRKQGNPRPVTRRPLCVRMPPDVLAYLDFTGDKTGTLESAVRRSPEYLRWRLGTRYAELPDHAAPPACGRFRR